MPAFIVIIGIFIVAKIIAVVTKDSDLNEGIDRAWYGSSGARGSNIAIGCLFVVMILITIGMIALLG